MRRKVGQKEGNGNTGLVYTNKARCRDCYRCVRACPVKAVKMENGQASVDKTVCLLCGTCIKECPQGAKSYVNDVEYVRMMLADEGAAAISVAPSFAAFYNEFEIKRLPSALRKAGFNYVAETSVGAELYTANAGKLLKKGEPNFIATCSAFMSYAEHKYPRLLKYITGSASPMILHAEAIKRELGGDTKVIFAGPCIAKKGEAKRDGYAGIVDAVITFEELNELLAGEGIEITKCEESCFDDKGSEHASSFPLSGGAFRTMGLQEDGFSGNYITAEGYREVREAMEYASSCNKEVIIEPLFCEGGCTGGPCPGTEANMFERKNRLLNYAASKEGIKKVRPVINVPLSVKAYISDDLFPSEEKIREILHRTGKYTEEDELDCGACGYDTCREKAIAVLAGKAELDMCMPYVKRLAQQRSDKIIESSPNGIVILDNKLNILHMNNSFKRFFMCSDSVAGRNISYLMDPAPFEEVKNGERNIFEGTIEHSNYNITCHQKIYCLEEKSQYAGIFVDITDNLDKTRQLDTLRSETIDKARELMEHQFQMAQKMAEFLGENAAKGEEIVEKMLALTEKSNSKRSGSIGEWLSSTRK